MAIVDLKKLMSTSKRAELFETLFSTEGKVLKFGDLLDTLTEGQQTLYIEAFRTFTVQELLDHSVALAATATGKAPKVTVDVPAIENFKDEAVQAAWKSKVVELLTSVGVGEGRGISPQAIRVAIGSANESQGRELMTQMETAGVIHATSKARGKKYVLAQFKDQAEAAWAKEQADAKAAEDAKAAAAAEKAKTAPVAPATPVTDGKAPKTPKAPKAG